MKTERTAWAKVTWVLYEWTPSLVAFVAAILVQMRFDSWLLGGCVAFFVTLGARMWMWQSPR